MNTSAKKAVFVLVFIISTASAGFLAIANAAAATTTGVFTTNLSFGMKGANVSTLQEFLAKQGVYSGPITGNYLTLTMQGVKQFQIMNNITPSSGYFGPLTRTKANAIAIAETTSTVATVSPSTAATATASSSPSSTSLLAYIQLQLNSMFQTVRNLQQKFFGHNSTAAIPTVTAAVTPSVTVAPASTPIVVSTGVGSSGSGGGSGGGGSTPTVVSTPAPTPTPTSTPKQKAAPVGSSIPSSTPNPTSTPIVNVTTNNSSISWGVYSGDSASSLASFTSLVGQSPNIQAIFLSMGVDSFPTGYTQTVGAAGKTLLIFWEPDNGSDDVNQSDFSYSAILSGKYDANMEQFAAAAKAYGYPVILVPMDEMNGNWDPWCGTVNGNTPSQFVQVWIHVHDIFAGVSNVKFGWDPNNESVPDTSANAISAYWPGSQYVDYVGVDGFNGNGDPWQSFSQMFPSSLLTQLASYGKPIYLFSIGSTEDPSNPLGKAEWITQGLGPNGAISSFPDIAGWVWFNENGGDSTSDWLVNSDPASLVAFQAAIP